jgi:hypothetical protein
MRSSIRRLALLLVLRCVLLQRRRLIDVYSGEKRQFVVFGEVDVVLGVEGSQRQVAGQAAGRDPRSWHRSASDPSGARPHCLGKDDETVQEPLKVGSASRSPVADAGPPGQLAYGHERDGQDIAGQEAGDPLVQSAEPERMRRPYRGRLCSRDVAARGVEIGQEGLVLLVRPERIGRKALHGQERLDALTPDEFLGRDVTSPG